MDLSTRCQLADLISESIYTRGIQPRTQPWIWMAQLFGPLFEKNIPMQAQSRYDKRTSAGVLVVLLPVLIVGFVLALPIELWRHLKAKRHNRHLDRLLAAGDVDAPAGSYREQASPNVDPVTAELLAELRAAERVAVVDYRIEKQARMMFCGSAVVTVTDRGQNLISHSVHRSVPNSQIRDGQAIKSIVESMLGAPVEQAYWEWKLGDAYELTERPARPW